MISARPRLKSIIIKLAIIIAIIGIIAFVWRYQILQYSAEKLVRKSLPDYITVEKMSFDFRNSRIVFGGMKILNPPNFYEKYLIEIGEVECRYKIKGGNILSGLEIFSPIIRKPVLYIDRLSDGRTNLQEMPSFMQKADQINRAPRKASGGGEAGKGFGKAGAADHGNLAGIVKLPEDFIVKDGKVIFMDGMVRPGPYMITLDGIESNLKLKLDSTYVRAMNIATTGSGFINGHPNQTIKWDTKYDPTTPALTMSNNFTVSGVDILTFLPYYDKYSPFVFGKGYFSGSLIFDFDNGSIGSNDEILLSQMSFSVKKGYENAQFLETTVPDLVKYFTSKSGDIIFDFKIKGPISNPQFYLGPLSKQAVAAMAIDKISQALKEASGNQANPQGAAASGPKSDIDKAAQYIKMFKGLLKENK